MDLPRPDREFQADLAQPHQQRGYTFGSPTDARAEDRKRARLIRKSCLLDGVKFNVEDARDLANRLDECASGEQEHETMASALYMGRHRFRLIGALWKLVANDDSARTFTIKLPEKSLTPEQFAVFDPGPPLKALRSALYRRGAGIAPGWLILCYHGEFNAATGLFDIHWHGVASGEMVAVVDALTTARAYRTLRSQGDTHQRVHVGRKPLTDLPYPLSYICQSWWPRRWRAEGANGTRIRGRIAEPFHTLWLLWMDRWSVQDITLLIGLRVGPAGLTPSKCERKEGER